MVFVAIALAGFVILAASFLFGHDHDHDIGHDFDHDHDASHTGGDANEHSVSIFSTKVLATFVMGFGAVGAILHISYGVGVTAASLGGIAGGIGLGFLMWAMLSLISKQQGSSETVIAELIGNEGVVTVAIEPGGLGEVGVTTRAGYLNFSARAKASIPKGRSIRILTATSATLLVEEITD